MRSSQVLEDFVTLQVLDASFCQHASMFLNLEFHGKGAGSLRIFLPRRLLSSFYNLINPFSRALKPREAEVLQSFRKL